MASHNAPAPKHERPGLVAALMLLTIGTFQHLKPAL